MPARNTIVKHVTLYASYLLAVWILYRFSFKFSDTIEELGIKPVIWLLPLFYFLKKEKLGLKSLGITTHNLFPAVYMSLGLGAIFVMEALFINFLKHEGLSFTQNLIGSAFLISLGLSFATSLTEEISFRGYIYNRLSYALENEWKANLITSGLWVLIHLPITFLVWKLDMPSALIYLLLTFLFSLGSAFLFARTKNVFSSVFLHVLWEWPIILFR